MTVRVHGERTYRVHGWTHLLVFAGLVLFTGIGGAFAIVGALQGNAELDWVFAFAIAAYMWWHVLREVFEVRVDAQGVCHFRALARRVSVPASSIHSISSGRFSSGQDVTVRYDGGKLSLLQPIDGFHELLTRLKALNPGLEIRGL